MKDKTIEAAEEMIYSLAVMDDDHPDVDPERYPLKYMFQTTWKRFQEVGSLIALLKHPRRICFANLCQ